jgi:ABC-type amino acid transport system permease subunit
MSALFEPLTSSFMPAFLAGMSVNFEIAGIALALGLALGVLLAFARLQGGMTGVAAGSIVGLMRAAPTFVVMFFLLNAMSQGAGLSGVMIVAISLVPYAAAYVADSGVDALRQLRAGSPLGCYLILPNIARAFFVLVMSSSAGAAIGVPEGIAVILRQAEKMISLGQMILLFAIGVACFGIPLQAAFAIVRLIQRHLGRAALREDEEALTGETAVSIER